MVKWWSSCAMREIKHGQTTFLKYIWSNSFKDNQRMLMIMTEQGFYLSA